VRATRGPARVPTCRWPLVLTGFLPQNSHGPAEKDFPIHCACAAPHKVGCTLTAPKRGSGAPAPSPCWATNGPLSPSYLTLSTLYLSVSGSHQGQPRHGPGGKRPLRSIHVLALEPGEGSPGVGPSSQQSKQVTPSPSLSPSQAPMLACPTLSAGESRATGASEGRPGLLVVDGHGFLRMQPGLGDPPGLPGPRAG